MQLAQTSHVRMVEVVCTSTKPTMPFVSVVMILLENSVKVKFIYRSLLHVHFSVRHSLRCVKTIKTCLRAVSMPLQYYEPHHVTAL